MATKQNNHKSFWGHVFELARQQKRDMKNNAKANGDDQALAMLGVGLGIIGAIAGAITMPWLYAVNFGVGIVMAVTGLVGGGLAGFAVPYAINKVIETVPWGIFKPSNYKIAMKKPQAVKTVPAAKTAKRKNVVTKTSKLDDTPSAAVALNSAANKNAPKQKTTKPLKNNPKAGFKS